MPTPARPVTRPRARLPLPRGDTGPPRAPGPQGGAPGLCCAVPRAVPPWPSLLARRAASPPCAPAPRPVRPPGPAPRAVRQPVPAPLVTAPLVTAPRAVGPQATAPPAVGPRRPRRGRFPRAGGWATGLLHRRRGWHRVAPGSAQACPAAGLPGPAARPMSRTAVAARVGPATGSSRSTGPCGEARDNSTASRDHQPGNRAAAQEGPRPALALEYPPVRPARDLGVLAGHRRIADDHVVVGAAPDPDGLARLEAVPPALVADLKLVHPLRLPGPGPPPSGPSR